MPAKENMKERLGLAMPELVPFSIAHRYVVARIENELYTREFVFKKAIC